MEPPLSLLRLLQAGLERRRQQGQYFSLVPSASQQGLVDFGSNDTLCLRSNDSVRKRFLNELEANPNFPLGAGASRVLGGSDCHVMELERYLADYHGAEDSLFFNSGYEANMAIYGSLPQRGDAIVHDEMIHASIRDGIRAGRASIVQSFEHNDVASLGQLIDNITKSSPAILGGSQTVFVALESIYSMEGDTAPVTEMLAKVKSILPAQNFVFVVDEAHSTGIVGPQGSGYIRHLGLEREAIIQMHSYAKAPGALGAVVICHPMVKDFLTNYGRNFIYSTGPTFPTIATVRACVETLRGEEGQRLRQQLQNRVRMFHEFVTRHPHWNAVKRSGVLSIPTLNSKNVDEFHCPVVPLITSTGLCRSLQEESLQHGFLTHGLHFPVVPRTGERVRLVIHAGNTTEELHNLVNMLMAWASKKVSAITRRRTSL
ncbi:hypothetical protein XA68_17629 [Ophiocordyceps unilateralis]|uniref:Aminotransferase class I/classII large domain-containing protein n=1 Tax=Ophiocordyceps unilateralis TaxID=268505 RepID=A0A2A9PKA4_OPHUN|nr:hypothetical protein XA68_17629 [Ophiocordyceps unilateralis]